MAAGAADVAAIDCVTYASLLRVVPKVVASTRILQWTREVPSLPFVISATRSRMRARAAGYGVRPSEMRHSGLVLGLVREIEPMQVIRYMPASLAHVAVVAEW